MDNKKKRIRVLFVLFVFSIINFVIFYNSLNKLDQIKNDITNIQTLEDLYFGKEKLNIIRDSLEGVYKLDKYKSILFKKDEIDLAEIDILRAFLNDLFNYYVINFQQQGSIYWFLKELESEKGLKFADNVYVKFDINNSKKYQSILVELNDASKKTFDAIYKFPDEIFLVMSNSKRLYYARQKDGAVYWNDLIAKHANKSEEDFLSIARKNSLSVLEPYIEGLAITTHTLIKIIDVVEIEVLIEKKALIKKYEDEKKYYLLNLGVLILLQLLIVLIIFQKDFKVTFFNKNLIKKNKKRNISIFFGSFLFFLSAIPLVYYLYYLELKKMEITSDIKFIDQNIKIYSENEMLLYDYMDIIRQTNLLHNEYALNSDQLTKNSAKLFDYTSNINKHFPALLHVTWKIAKKTNKMAEIVYVEDVVKNSPSYNLIYKYDKILSVNNKTVTYDNFFRFIDQSKEGDFLSLQVLRKNEIINVDIKPKMMQFYNKFTDKNEKKKIIGIYFKSNYPILNNIFTLQDNVEYNKIPNLYEVLDRSADPKNDVAYYLNKLHNEISYVATSTNNSINNFQAEKADLLSLQNKIGRKSSLILIVVSILDILGTFLLYLFIRIEGSFKKLNV